MSDHKTDHFLSYQILDIGDGPHGNKISIPYIKFDSHKPGKTIYMQSGMHGGEVTIWILQKILDLIKTSEEFSGKLIIVPTSNPLSLQQRAYFYTLGKFNLYDGKDWNRNFPGNVDGTLAQRMAHHLFSLASQSDLIIDLHTSRKSFPFAIITDQADRAVQNCLDMEYVMVINTNSSLKQKYQGTLLMAATDENIQTITYECGSHDRYEAENIEIITNSILNLLFPLKKAKENKLESIYYDTLVTYRAPLGGYVTYSVPIGRKYKKNDVLFQILKPDLSAIESIRAGEDGILQKQSPTHIVWPGDDVLECIPADRIFIDFATFAKNI